MNVLFFRIVFSKTYPDDTVETSTSKTPINEGSSIVLVSVVLSFLDGDH